MNIKKIQKQLLIGLATVVFMVINFFVIFLPLFQETSNLRKTFNINKIKIEDLKKNESQKEEIAKKKKFYKRELVEINERLPNYLVPEKFIILLKEYAQQSKITVQNFSFSIPEEYNISGVTPEYSSSGPQTKQADDMIVGLFLEDENEGVKATKEELQFEGIQEEKPIKVEVNFTFDGSYNQVKEFLSSLEMILSNITVNYFSIQPNEAGFITGQTTIVLYGFKDSKIPIFDLWSTELERGKVNVFGKEGSTRYNINDVNVSDFDIALNPHTSDSPTVILRKHGNYSTAIYGDNKGIEQVELQIIDKGGKLFYRYKTMTSSYPPGFNYTEFKPVNSKDLIVKIYSKPRYTDIDNSGMNLVISKPANREVKVMIYNDDKVKPRVKYEIK